MPAPPFTLLPQDFAFPRQGQVVLHAQQNQVVDHRRLRFERSQLDGKIFGLGGTASQEETDTHFPWLAVFASPMTDTDCSVSRMFTKGPLADDVLQAPGTHFYSV